MLIKRFLLNRLMKTEEEFRIMKETWKQKLKLIIMHRYVLILINLLLLSIVISIIIELFDLVKTPENDTKEMIDMCDGIAIILYGYGVALKLRDEIMKLFKLYPGFATRLQTGIDALCHKYGIYFLLLGLAQEILVQIVVIPNRALNTEGKESYIFAVCLFMQVIVSFLFIKSSILLLRLPYTAKTKGK
jgi:hypothetical protein